MIYRKYPMKGTENTRDLGGYPTKDGGVTKFGVFVRSDAWDKATEEDIAFIKNLGIRTVVDLRTKEQAEKNPHPLSRKEVSTITMFRSWVEERSPIQRRNSP